MICLFRYYGISTNKEEEIYDLTWAAKLTLTSLTLTMTIVKVSKKKNREKYLLMKVWNFEGKWCLYLEEKCFPT